MPRDLILHIGTTKTGSTSIQQVLAQHRAVLLKQGFSYPVSPGADQHRLLAYSVMANPKGLGEQEKRDWDGMGRADRLALFRAEFAEEMRKLPASVNTVILSSEFIYIHLRTAQEVQLLHDFLAPFFRTMRVVVYLRRQDTHFTSFYSQILRTGQVIAGDDLKMRQRTGHELDYAVLLNRWAGIFGSANILPKLFQNQDGKRFDVVQDFLDFCGVKLPPGAAEQTQTSNPSINLGGQRLLVDLGRVLKSQRGVANVAGPVWRSLTDAVTQTSPGRGWRPTRAKAEAFYKTYEASNEHVRATWFPKRKTLFSEDFSEYPEQPLTVPPEELYQAALSTILYYASQQESRPLHEARALAQKAEASGKRNNIRAALVRCIRADRNDVESRIALARMHIEDQKLLAARGLVNAALTLAPENPAARDLAAALAALEAGE